MDRDYSKKFVIEDHKVKHASFLPRNIFCVIAGATGCGKTNLLLNFLLEDDILDYSDVYIYASTLHQKAYKYLKEYYNDLETTIKNKYNISITLAHFFDTDDKIINPSQLDPLKNHVIVFDDVMLDDQTKIKEYFCKGRHNNVNIFYLCQSYYKIAKHCIRDNANTFILFRQDDKTMKYFYDTHISGDMDFKEFKKFYDNSWIKQYGFIVINLWDKPYCGKYTSNYKDIYIPDKYQKISKNI